jgi:hypothetical protein
MSPLKSARLCVAILSCGVLAGCESNAGTGAVLGGASGAGLGAIIGHNSHNRTGSGALIGGAIGAASGALIGNEVDKQQRERDYRDYRDYDDRGPDVIERDRVVERPVYREYVYEAPPPPPAGYVEVVPARPYSRATWVPGHWVRAHHGWVWVRGYWG